MQPLAQAHVKDKKVLVRVGFDVPVGTDGKISDDTRIQEALPTITWLRERGAKIILLSHRGRPDGHLDPQDSLLPTAQYLEVLLHEPVEFITEKMEEKVSQYLEGLKDRDVIMLENLRFHEGEEKNDPRFASWLASLGEIYVNDAFSDCHRAHASIVGLPKLLPSFVGIGLEKEIKTLTDLMQNPARPVVAIIGGAKLESKLPAITNLLPVVDQILIGSKFLGENLPNSPKIISPVDTVKDEKGDHLDIGPETIEKYRQILSGAQTILWSGPLGLFEDDRYQGGSKKIAEILASHSAQTIVGGGDTIAALQKFSLLSKMKYTSTGGSAMLDFLAGKKLPGIEALG
jgi:3-phosphoglycerate kinase